MTNIRLFAVIAVSVVITAVVMGAITQPARADAPKVAVCTPPLTATTADLRAHPELPNNAALLSVTLMNEWMNGQLAAGRTSFSPVPISGSATSGLCAW